MLNKLMGFLLLSASALTCAQAAELHDAARADDLEQVTKLIQAGADVNAKDAQGMTPLRWAALVGAMDVAEFLLANRAEVDARDNDGRTPLYWACARGHGDVAELLLTHGADISARDSDGATPLFPVALDGIYDVAELLLARGADVNARNTDGDSPLILAIAARSRKEMVKLLLDKGADANARNKDGLTPLNLAANLGDATMVQMLVTRGADVNLKDNQGRTPLHIAVAKDLKDVAGFLLAHGADVNARTGDGATPLHLARSAGIRELLLAKGADAHAKDDAGNEARAAAQLKEKLARVAMFVDEIRLSLAMYKMEHGHFPARPNAWAEIGLVLKNTRPHEVSAVSIAGGTGEFTLTLAHIKPGVDGTTITAQEQPHAVDWKRTCTSEDALLKQMLSC